MSFQPQNSPVISGAPSLVCEPGDSGMLVQIVSAGGSAYLGGSAVATSGANLGFLINGGAAPVYIPPSTSMGAADVGGAQSGLYGITTAGTVTITVLPSGH